MPSKTVAQDFGLLQAVDERLAMYGWLTNTGVKFVIVIDMEGRASSLQDSKNPAVLGLKNSDLTPVYLILLSLLLDIDANVCSGIPGNADCVHQPYAEPFLYP